MAKIFKLRIDESPTDANLVAEKPWAWCGEKLGYLMRIPSKGPPVLTAEDARPDLAPFRGPQFVVVQLEKEEAGATAGYYLASSITPRELEKKLLEEA